MTNWIAIVTCMAGACFAAADPAAGAEPARLADAGNPTPDQLAATLREHCGQTAAKAAAEQLAVSGRDDWLFLARELRHVGVGTFWGPPAAKVSRASRPEWADPLPAILDFHKQLKELDIELLVLPVPPKAVIYPDKLLGEADRCTDARRVRLDPHHQAFYKLLAGKGVPVMDLTETFLAARADDEKHGPVWCRTDTHWSGRACRIAAAKLAAEVVKAKWYADVPQREDIKTRTQDVKIIGDLQIGADEPQPETLPLRFVHGPGGKPLPPDRKSPVLLLGDSHCLVFHSGGDMHATGAGLSDQLAAELGFAIDLLGVKGSGATPSRISLYRRGRADDGYIAGKKLIIWCFSAREFTESRGWRKVPVVKR